MVSIAICDDDVLEVERAQRFIEKYSQTKNESQISVQTFLNPLEMLNYVDKNVGFDIYILDIIMDGMKGTDVAKELKAKESNCEIIFMTTSREFAVDAFALNAVHYLVKPYDFVDFSEALARALKRTEVEETDFIVRKTDKGVMKILIANICFSESSGHYQYVHMNDGTTYKIRSKTFELWEDLKNFNRFLIPHTGFIVNMDYIKNVTSYGIEVLDANIPLSKNTYGKIRKEYLDYTFGK